MLDEKANLSYLWVLSYHNLLLPVMKRIGLFTKVKVLPVDIIVLYVVFQALCHKKLLWESCTVQIVGHVGRQKIWQNHFIFKEWRKH